LTRILPELRDLYPKLRLHIREASAQALESGLAAGHYDLILTVLPLNSVDNQVRPLFVEPFDLVMPAEHPLAMKSLVRLSDLEHQEVLAVDDEHLQRQVANVCEKSGAQLVQAYEGNSLSTLEQMVMMGMGLAIMPALFVRTEITGKASRLVVMPLGNEIPGRTHVAAWRRNAPGRQLFQKVSYDIKVLALDVFSHVLDEVNTEEGF
jgi:LysR family hydrogen peroxide-inducible transcriptional activator